MATRSVTASFSNELTPPAADAVADVKTNRKRFCGKPVAEEFLEILDPTRQFWNFRAIWPEGRGDPPEQRACKLHGSLSQQWEALERLSGLGYGIYVVINPGGDTDRQIGHATVLWTDDDACRPEVRNDYDPPPTAIIKSSFGKHHAYWKLKRSISSEEFTARQKALAKRYGTDTSISNPSRVMRLPGLPNTKSDPPVLTEILLSKPERVYDPDEVVDLASNQQAVTRETRRRDYPSTRFSVESKAPKGVLLQIVGQAVKRCELNPSTARHNQALWLGGAMAERGLSANLATAAALVFIEHAPKKERKLAPDEIVRAIEHGYQKPDLGWDTPGEVRAQLLPVEVLNPRLIPGPYQDWIEDGAQRMSVPLDFMATCAVVVTGSLIGTACAIRPKRKDDWSVIPNLWGAAIARPAVMLKSPSLREPMALLDRLQAKKRKEHDDAMNRFALDKMVREAKKKALKETIEREAKKKQPDPHEFDRLQREFTALQDAHEPTIRLFKTNETSIQGMTVLQAQNGRGLLVYRDEVAALLARWDREEFHDERAYFLEGWNGNGSFTDYKISRGLTTAENICVSIYGGIQPSRLRNYLRNVTEGMNDGLIQRFQLAVYPDEPSAWRLVDEDPDVRARERAYAIFEKLATMDFRQYGAHQAENDPFPWLRFAADAQALFNEWLVEHQARLIREQDPLVAEHLGKYRSLMPSLALVFHAIDMADGIAEGAVSLRAATLAAGWCEYLESHARRIYGLLGTRSQQAAQMLAEKILTGRLEDGFSARDVYRQGWTLLDNRQAVEAAARELEHEQWLRKEATHSSGEPGRPELPRYRINPQLRLSDG